MNANRPAVPRQRGTVLIIVLMFLTVLMLMATVAVSTGVSEEKLARASRDYNVAFQAAEAALRDARFDLTGTGSRAPVIISNASHTAAAGSCTVTGLCTQASAGGTPVWETVANWTNAVPYGTYTGVQTLPTTGPGAVSQQPRYIIEYIAPSGSQHIYRITARGWGPLANSTPVTLQEEVLR
ncbi:MAG TPA: PilX N-terminal domain-containing pilus assembly protein [Vicinamibacterales bacterium]|nr:PilX N-terminal domain-containing pilus assembly protein [Vicinamibacterales bacterium]